MKDRIRELWAQCVIKHTKTPMNWQDVADEFAELIVRECLNEIESQRSNGENDDQWTITRDLCYHNMMAQLKQHFGVKE